MRKLKYILITIFMMLLVTSPLHAKQWAKKSLIGGTANDLDSLTCVGKTNGDLGHVTESGVFYLYIYNSSGTDSEDTTNYSIIVPDDRVANCAGSGQWELVTGIAQAPSAYPSSTYIDSDTTDADPSARIVVNCTDTGTGAEDCDIYIAAQEAGSDISANPPGTWKIHFDADGNIEVADDIDLATGKVYKINNVALASTHLSDTANIGMLNEAETIAGNWVNTANPWAENELVSTVVVEGDVDDTPANGATTDPVSSNWAYDHENAADPHGVYLLESQIGAAYDTEAELDALFAARLLLAGGVLTGEVTVDNLGLEFTPGDDHTDCSAFSATGGGIFYDDSEGIFKKCQDNVLTDLDTGAGTINTADIADVNVTQTEFAELETIGATTISANQWALLGGLAETLTAAEVNILDGVTGVTAAELSFIGDVTSAIQAQLDTKAAIADVDVEMLNDVTGEGTAATYALFDDNDGTYSFRAIADGDIPAAIMRDSEWTAASTTAQGKVELATAAETTTGTDTGRAITPDGLAGSNYGKEVIGILVFDDSEDTAVADGAGDVFFRIPSILNGWNLVEVAAQVQTAGTTGNLDIMIYNVTDTADFLSTAMRIETGETDTSTSAQPGTINTATDDVATGDSIRIDVDSVQTTAAKGLYVELIFQLP